MPGQDRLDGELDAVLHLLDRQVVDSDGLAVCKVDDLEVTEHPDGRLAVSGILVGGAALVPRFGGRLARHLERRRAQLAPERADRDTPYRLGLDRVERLGSAVELDVPRTDLLVPQPGPAEGFRHRRLDDLLQMPVSDTEGRGLGGVLDVRLQGRSPDGLLVTAVVVGHARPGALLGYDRSQEQGPWLVARPVRWLLRHSRLVEWSAVEEVDWEDGVLTVSTADHPHLV